MGTDIHETFYAKIEGEWKEIESTYGGNRHYNLFAHLADVRNGYGFAGTITGTPVTPIADPRGLPVWLTMEKRPDDGDEDALDEWYSDHWFGDHSFTWLTADEILAREFYQGGYDVGVITIDQYKTWDRNAPDDYSGDIWGRDIHVAEREEDIVEGKTTHVRVSWPKGRSGREFDYFTDEIKRLKDLHGEVVMVMGFDS